MFCNKCGFELTEDQTVCSNCGQELVEPAVAEEAVTPEAAVTEEAEQPVADVAASAECDEAVAEAPEQEEAAVQVEPIPAQPKKKKTGLVLGIVGGVVAVAAVLVAVFFGQIKGFAIKTFGDSADYYRYVESAASAKLNAGVAEAYGTYIEAETQDAAAETKMTFDVSKAAQDDLCEQLGGELDLSWLNDVAVTSSYNIKGEALSSDVKLKINDTDIVALELLEDIKDKVIYFGLPSLNDRYIAITDEDVETADEGSFILMQIVSDDEIRKALPSQEELNELLDKYTGIMLENVEDVEMSTETVEIDGVKQKLTVVKVEIEPEDAKVIAKALLNEARGDKVIKKYINDISKLFEKKEIITDADEVYDDFVKSIDEALEEIDEDVEEEFEDEFEEEETFTLYTYVDSAHNVVGRKVSIEGDELSYVTVKNGKKVGLEVLIDSGEDDTLFVRAKGVRGGKLMNMDLSLGMNDTTALVGTVKDIKLKELNEGYFNGKLHLDVLRGFYEIQGMTNAEIAEIEGDKVSIDMTFEAEKDQSTAKFVYNINGKSYVGMKVSTKLTEPKKVTLPKEDKTVAVEDVGEWATSFDLTKIVDALEDAKLPEEIVQIAEVMLDPNSMPDYGDEIYNEDLPAPGGEGEYGDEELWGDEEYWDDEDWGDLGI